MKTGFHLPSLQQVRVEALKAKGRRFTSTAIPKIVLPLVLVKAVNRIEQLRLTAAAIRRNRKPGIRP
jgi:hypothetical protein